MTPSCSTLASAAGASRRAYSLHASIRLERCGSCRPDVAGTEHRRTANYGSAEVSGRESGCRPKGTAMT